jgi:hypothetical protein
VRSAETTKIEPAETFDVCAQSEKYLSKSLLIIAL